MGKEVPFQVDMFSGALVDTRTQKQKKKAKAQQGPQQTEMFSQRELAQFGVNPHPQLPISPKTRIELMIEDRRTEEEKVDAIWQAALQHNYRLFTDEVLVELSPVED